MRSKLNIKCCEENRVLSWGLKGGGGGEKSPWKEVERNQGRCPQGGEI